MTAPRRRPGSRGPEPSFDREDVLAAARRIPRDRLSMAAIGAELGVSAASIYRHFSGKQAILEALLPAERAMLAPPSRKKSMRRWLAEAAAAELGFWRANPEFREIAGRVLLSGATEEWMSAGVAVITREGLAASDALYALSSVGLAASALAMIEASWDESRPTPSSTGDSTTRGTPTPSDFDEVLAQVVRLVLDGLEFRRQQVAFDSP